MTIEFKGFSDDSPVALPSQDRFGRAGFAKRISEVLTKRRDPASLVVGLFAPWGDGKTSASNFIRSFLAEDPSLITVLFNPWRFEGELSLLDSFFETLAQALDKNIETRSQQLGTVIRDYSKLLKLIPKAAGADVIAEEIGKKLSETSLSIRRNHISELLRNSEKRVVVFLDDIDRLEKKEIQEIFKLVKLVADFDNVTYLLTFDDEMVAAAIGERFTSEAKDYVAAGTRYLEKIIQVGLHLPAVSVDILRSYCFGLVDDAVSSASMELTQAEVDDFVQGFIIGLQSRLKTPRLAKRYGNALHFSLGLLQGEVKPSDLMLIEAVRVFYPPLHRGIHRHKEALTTNHERGKFSHSDFVKQFLPTMDQHDLTSASKVLEFLFPGTLGVSASAKETAREKRISSPDYFDRYFSYSLNPDEISDLWFEGIVKRAASSDHKQIAQEVAEYAVGKRAENFVFRVRAREQKVTASQAKALSASLILIAERLSDNPTVNFLATPRSQAAAAIAQMLYALPKQERVEFMSVLLGDSVDFPFVFDLLRAARNSKRGEEALLDEDQKTTIFKFAAKSALLTVAGLDHPIWSSASSNDAAKLMALISWGSEAEVVSKYVQDWLAKRPDTVLQYVQTRLGTRWSMTNGRLLDPDLEKSSYDSLVSEVPADFLAELLNEQFGPIDLPKYDFWDEEVDLGFKLANQFLAIHQQQTKLEPELPASDVSTTPA